MKLIPMHVGDRIYGAGPNKDGSPRLIVERCADPSPVGFVCLLEQTDFYYCATVDRLLSMIGGTDRAHKVAEACGTCRQYHPLTTATLRELTAQAQLWPLIGGRGERTAASPPTRQSSG